MKRKPQQERSIKTKEKIIETAYKLFCENGYHATTTNEIAKVAEISIGSLYFYFPNKEEILMEVLTKYNEQFLEKNEGILELQSIDEKEPRQKMELFMNHMIHMHQEFRQINQELEILSYSIPEVALVLEEQKEKIRKMIFSNLSNEENALKIKDLEAAAFVVNQLISSTVDQIAYHEDQIDSGRLINETIDAIDRYLYQ